MNNKICPNFSIWKSKKNGKLVTVLGKTKIPEAKENGIIIGHVDNGVMTFSLDKFIENFIRYDKQTIKTNTSK